MKEFEIGMRVLIIGESRYPQFSNPIGKTGVITEFDNGGVGVRYDEHPTPSGMWIEKWCIEPYALDIGNFVIYIDESSELLHDLIPVGSIGIVKTLADWQNDLKVEFAGGELWVERKNVRLARTNDDIQRIVGELRR